MSADISPVPDGKIVYDRFGGYVKPMLLRLALSLDVFTPLDQGPATFRAVASACRTDPVGIHHLGDYLTCQYLLTHQDDLYALTSSAAMFFVRDSPPT